MKLLQTGNEQTFFDIGYHSKQLQLLSHRRLQASLPTGPTGRGLPSEVSRLESANIGG